MTHDLAGAWRLVSWSLEYEDSRPNEFPLGREACGLLLYTSGGPTGGWVSATLMNTGQPSASLAYAREGDVLTLSGPDFRAGTERSQKIVWRRAS